MRTLLLIAPLLLTTAALAFEGPVDLNRPGVMDQIQHDNPKRYRAIEDILKVSAELPCKTEELKLLATRFGVEDLECGVLLLTSYPAQRNVHFHLDGIEFQAMVKVDAEATFESAGQSSKPTAVDAEVNYR